jgi:hypothetical protein
MIELKDVGFALVLALTTIGIATLFGLWRNDDTRRAGCRGGRGKGQDKRHRG